MKKKLHIGDVFEIPLPDGRKAFGQYVFFDKKYGALIQVYKSFLKKDESLDIEKLLKEKDILFGPVFTALFAAIRLNKWEVIGHLPIIDFKYPGFISTLTKLKTGEASTWYLWDGEQSVRLGKNLENKYKELEYLAIYPGDFIVERIMTGKKYRNELIMTNKEPGAPPLSKEEKERLNKLIHESF